MLIKKLLFLLCILVSVPSFAGWTAWTNLGGTIRSDPAACTNGNLTYVFGRGTDNNIWFRKRYLPTGLWSSWKRLPVISTGSTQLKATGSPGVTCSSGGMNTFGVLVSVVATDNRVWNILVTPSLNSDNYTNWYKYTDFNAATAAGPAIARDGVNIYYFVRGGDNRIYEGHYSDFFRVLVSEFSYNDPTAIAPGGGRIDFFYRDQFGKLWQRFKFGTLWYPRTQIPGVTYPGPEVVSRDISTLDLFSRGYNSTLQHKRSINGVWGPWVNLGGSVASGPGAATYASNQRIMVFVRWTDGSLRYRAWAP